MKYELVTETELPFKPPSRYEELKSKVKALEIGQILKVDFEGAPNMTIRSNLSNWGSQWNIKIRYRTGPSPSRCLYIWKEHWSE